MLNSPFSLPLLPFSSFLRSLWLDQQPIPAHPRNQWSNLLLAKRSCSGEAGSSAALFNIISVLVFFVPVCFSKHSRIASVWFIHMDEQDAQDSKPLTLSCLSCPSMFIPVFVGRSHSLLPRPQADTPPSCMPMRDLRYGPLESKRPAHPSKTALN